MNEEFLKSAWGNEKIFDLDTRTISRVLSKIRWPHFIHCPFCNSIRINEADIVLKIDGFYHCSECKKYFDSLTKTMLQRTRLSLHQWLLIFCRPEGILPSYLAKRVGIHHWTATKILRKITGKTTDEILNKSSISAIEDLADFIFNEDKDTKRVAVVIMAAVLLEYDAPMLARVTDFPIEQLNSMRQNLQDCYGPDLFDPNHIDSEWLKILNGQMKDSKDLTSEEFLHLCTSLTMTCMCATGDLKRTPAGVFSLKEPV